VGIGSSTAGGVFKRGATIEERIGVDSELVQAADTHSHDFIQQSCGYGAASKVSRADAVAPEAGGRGELRASCTVCERRQGRDLRRVPISACGLQVRDTRPHPQFPARGTTKRQFDLGLGITRRHKHQRSPSRHLHPIHVHPQTTPSHCTYISFTI
jgi:hypothetical protein